MVSFRAMAVSAAVLAGLVAAGLATPLAAQPARPAKPLAASPATPAPAVPATPQQTTASFADWTLRCSHLASGAQFCEVAQNVQRDDRPVAQIALGRPGKGQPLQLTMLVPPNVAIAPAPALLAGKEGDAAPVAELAWRRCLPGGCMADVALSDDAVRRLRGWTEPGRIVFADSVGRPAALPVSPRGLSQALDALAKEDGG